MSINVFAEKDLNNPSVKAVMQIFDIPVEAMRQKLERIRITEGNIFRIKFVIF